MINSSNFYNSKIIKIIIEITNLGGKKVLEINEGATVAVTTEYLSASDLDTADNFLVFDILEYPIHGNILIDNNVIILKYETKYQFVSKFNFLIFSAYIKIHSTRYCGG